MAMNNDAAVNQRMQVLNQCRQVVIKVGTRLLTDPARIPELIGGIAKLRDRHLKVLLVSSGAVGIGMGELGLSRRPRRLSEVQALAAIGQEKLMARYDQACRECNFKSAQLLLTAADLRSRERYLNVSNCIEALWNHGVLPIVNENDSVSVDELKFGDNDILSGMLATLTGAALTVILTTEQGLRKRNSDGTLGERIPIVTRIDDQMRASAGGTDDSAFSIGGMTSKLRAAGMVTAAGGALWIADGRQQGILEQIFNGEDVGTLFLPRGKMHGKKRFIRFFSRCVGSVTIDGGAVEAVASHGKSLLPSGVTAVSGKFKRGDTIEIQAADGSVVGRGLSNFSSEECQRILGLHGGEIAGVLGADADEELIHRDNLSVEIV